MKLKSILAALVLAVAFVGSASAQNFWRTGWYTQGNLGLSTPNDGNYDTAPSLEGTVGKIFNNWFAVEATLGYFGTPTNEQNRRVDGTYMLLTPMLRLQNTSPVTPYAGVAGGYVWTGGSGTQDAGSFAWGPTLGLTMQMSTNWNLNLQYRYLMADDADIVNVPSGRVDTLQINQFLIGLRFTW
jgi:opacity protein-like surface antigen